jgi:hypothetical protein
MFPENAYFLSMVKWSTLEILKQPYTAEASETLKDISWGEMVDL